MDENNNGSGILCPSCGKPAGSNAGLSMHMIQTHRVSWREWLDGNREGFRSGNRVSKPTVIHHPTPIVPLVQPPPRVEDRPITRIKNMEVVTDGVRVGIVEWQGDD